MHRRAYRPCLHTYPSLSALAGGSLNPESETLALPCAGCRYQLRPDSLLLLHERTEKRSESAKSQHSTNRAVSCCSLASDSPMSARKSSHHFALFSVLTSQAANHLASLLPMSPSRVLVPSLPPFESSCLGLPQSVWGVRGGPPINGRRAQNPSSGIIHFFWFPELSQI